MISKKYNEQMGNYLAKLAQAQTQATNTSAVPWGKCDKICSYKTDLGYCAFTACINPDYNRNSIYGASNGF